MHWQTCPLFYDQTQWIPGDGRSNKMLFTELTLTTVTCGMGSYLFRGNQTFEEEKGNPLLNETFHTALSPSKHHCTEATANKMNALQLLSDATEGTVC